MHTTTDISNKTPQRRTPAAPGAARHVSPHAVLTQCLAKANGKFARAKVLFEQRLHADPELLRAFLSQAIDQYLLTVSATQRAKIAVASMRPANPDDTRDIALVAARTKQTLLDQPLHDGLTLGDATADDLRRGITQRRTQARTMVRNALFYELLLHGLRGRQRVRDVYNETGARRLLLQAEKQTTSSDA